jgi:hypothetical protein
VVLLGELAGRIRGSALAEVVVNQRCDPMAAPDVMIEHFGPLLRGEPCGWQISFIDRARPDAKPLFVWDGPWKNTDDDPWRTCTEANQLVRELRDSSGLMAALRTGDLEWAYQQVDAITADAEGRWSA